MRVFGKVFMIMIPILLVLGLIGVLVSTTHQFLLPRTNQFVAAFDNLNTLQWSNNWIATARNYQAQSQSVFDSLNNISVTDWNSFWSAVGVFFSGVGLFISAIGSYVVMFGSYILMPFELIGWVFGSVWGWIPQQP